jgi:hypothetical protein
VLHDEHIGDASIEGKLKKLVKRAEEVGAAQKTQQWTRLEPGHPVTV